MELIFAYIAGLLTLINPCILPVLPLVLGAGIQAHRHAPLAMALGLSMAFVALGMLVATVGHSIGLTSTKLSQIGAILMILFGLILLVPRFSDAFTRLTSGIGEQADENLRQLDNNSLKSQFISGMLLGVVWSPCIGPTLGGAISLASQGQDLIWAFLIMLSFAMGVSSVIIALGYGTQEVIRRRQHSIRGIAEKAKPIMGGLLILIGFAILFKIHHFIESWLLEVMPIWLQDLSVAF